MEDKKAIKIACAALIISLLALIINIITIFI